MPLRSSADWYSYPSSIPSPSLSGLQGSVPISASRAFVMPSASLSPAGSSAASCWHVGGAGAEGGLVRPPVVLPPVALSAALGRICGEFAGDVKALEKRCDRTRRRKVVA